MLNSILPTGSAISGRACADAPDRRIASDHPFAGARMLPKMLKREGSLFGRRRVATLMKQMGIHAIYRKPSTSIQSFFDRLSPCLTIEPAFSAFKTYGKGGLFFLYPASQSIDVRADHGIIITHEAIGSSLSGYSG